MDNIFTFEAVFWQLKIEYTWIFASLCILVVFANFLAIYLSLKDVYQRNCWRYQLLFHRLEKMWEGQFGVEWMRSLGERISVESSSE